MVAEWEWIARLFLAALLGGIVGMERESHGREAGFRTLILVCTGTCLVMITSLRIPELFTTFSSNSVLRIDPARIAYGTITGIGFLGAGAIVRDRRRTRGITTAACLWGVAAVGLATGCGFYHLAVTSTVISIAVLYLLRFAEHLVLRDTYNQIVITQEGERGLAPFLDVLTEFKIKVLNRAIKIHTPPPMTEIELMVRHKEPEIGEKVVRKLLTLPGVKVVEWK